MRYAIFTDIHANLEALHAVLAKIDELAQHDPIDQIWFLGDLVGYGPNPNECIRLVRERTTVVIAGNHDWAAVGKIDLEDFSPAARTSAEWTAKQLTEEHQDFLSNLPERLDIDDCTLVHGSPFGPLWEYLTSEVLAERSFEHFSSRYCFVGHTHIPVIFQQPDLISNVPTAPLESSEQEEAVSAPSLETFDEEDDNAAVTENGSEKPGTDPAPTGQGKSTEMLKSELELAAENDLTEADIPESIPIFPDDYMNNEREEETEELVTAEEVIVSAEDRLKGEIAELLELLGLSQNMVAVTNEMVIPPEGNWSAPDGYRAIVNPGGVGQPRDGDPRAAFMVYDTKRGFTFYRVPYDYEKTQEKISKAGLPHYLATRLAYGR